MATQLIFSQALTVSYVNVELGEPGPGQVKVKTVLSAISHGTEMVAFVGKAPFLNWKMNEDRCFVPKTAEDPPFYPFHWAGYDSVGVVTAVGAGVEDFKVGDRVFYPKPHMDERILEASGEFFKIAQTTPAEDAIMTSLATVAFVAAQDAEVKLGDSVVVFGGGAVGQLAVQMAFLNGAGRVFLVEPHPQRRAMAESLSAVETIDPTVPGAIVGSVVRKANGGKWPDVVIECSGSVPGLKGAIQCAGVAGTVIATGFYAEPSTAIIFGEEFLHNRITMKASMGVWGCPSRWPLTWDRIRDLKTVLNLIEKKRLKFDGFVSLRVPFKEAQRAYDTIRAEPRHMKVVLTYE